MPRGFCRATERYSAPRPGSQPHSPLFISPLLPSTIERLDFGAAKNLPFFWNVYFNLNKFSPATLVVGFDSYRYTRRDPNPKFSSISCPIPDHDQLKPYVSFTFRGFASSRLLVSSVHAFVLVKSRCQFNRFERFYSLSGKGMDRLAVTCSWQLYLRSCSRRGTKRRKEGWRFSRLF